MHLCILATRLIILGLTPKTLNPSYNQIVFSLFRYCKLVATRVNPIYIRLHLFILATRLIILGLTPKTRNPSYNQIVLSHSLLYTG